MSSLQQQQQFQEYPRIVNIRQDKDSQDTFLKAFLISDRLNKMEWQIPDNALRKYVHGFIGKPLIQHPTGLHPDYEKEGLFSQSPTYIQDILQHQQQYAVGDIVDVQYESVKSASGEKTNENAWFAYIRMRPDKSVALTKLKSASAANESIYVSPQVIDLDAVGPNEKTTNFIPTHLAIVNQPAYGAHAKIRGMCNGHLSQCVTELKSAAYTLKQDDSSLVNFSSNEVISMPKSNLSPEQQQQQVAYGTTGVQQPQQQQVAPNNTPQQQQVQQVEQQQQPQQQTLSEKRQVTEQTPDGKLVTRTEVSKPITGNNQQQLLAQAPLATLVPQNPETVINEQQQPQIPNQPATNEVAFDWNKLPVEVKQMFEGLQKRVEDVENYKRQEEDNKVKQAAEQQRATIEQALSVIQDENVRTQLVDFFASLPITDAQMQNLLSLLLNGSFNAPDGNGAQAQAPATGGTAAAGATAPPAAKKPRGFPAKPGLKSAAFINSGHRFAAPSEFEDYGTSASGLLDGVDFGNI